MRLVLVTIRDVNDGQQTRYSLEIWNMTIYPIIHVDSIAAQQLSGYHEERNMTCLTKLQRLPLRPPPRTSKQDVSNATNQIPAINRPSYSNATNTYAVVIIVFPKATNVFSTVVNTFLDIVFNRSVSPLVRGTSLRPRKFGKTINQGREEIGHLDLHATMQPCRCFCLLPSSHLHMSRTLHRRSPMGSRPRSWACPYFSYSLGIDFYRCSLCTGSATCELNFLAERPEPSTTSSTLG